MTADTVMTENLVAEEMMTSLHSCLVNLSITLRALPMNPEEGGLGSTLVWVCVCRKFQTRHREPGSSSWKSSSGSISRRSKYAVNTGKSGRLYHWEG